MADYTVTVDYTDLKLFNEYLNKTSANVKATIINTASSFDEFKRSKMDVDRLRSSIDPLYAATSRYEKQVEVLNRALQNEAITLTQQKTILQQLSTAYGITEGKVTSLGVASQLTGRKMSRGSMVAQQFGYQIGDFFVQVQSGQSALIAFAQQGTQLAGLLPGIAGAVIGIGLAVTTMGAGILRARSGAKDFEDALKSAREEASDLAEEVARVATGITDVTESTLRNSLAKAQEALAYAQANPFLQLPEGQSTRNVAENRVIEAQKVVELAQKELDALINNRNILAAIEESNERRNEQAERNASIARQIQEIRQQERETLAAANAYYEDQARSLQQSVALQLQMVIYGEDSLEVERLRNEQALENYRLTLDTKNLTEEQVNNLEASFRFYQDLVQQASELERSQRAASETVARLMDELNPMPGVIDSASRAADALNSRLGRVLGTIRGILGALGNIGFGNIALAAENRALEAGQSAGQASIEGQLARRGAELSSGGVSGLAASAVIFAERQALEEELQLRTQNEALLDSLNASGGSDSGSSSSGSGRDEVADRLAKLREQLDLQQALIGKTETQVDLLNALGIGYEEVYGADTINALTQQINLINQMNETLERQQEVSDVITNSMSSAFESMADGTKSVSEAFRDMAREIIIELNKVLFIQNLVGNFNAATGEGSGLANIIGSALFSTRASGGSMTAGQPYLVGERGPELVVPKHSGTVVNAQQTTSMGKQQIELILHSDSGVSIETVRQEVGVQITRAAPSMVNASVKASQKNLRTGSKTMWGL